VAIKPVNLHDFFKNVGNIYEAIVVTSKRARQIHDEIKIELSQRLETIKQLTSTTEAEEEMDNAAANPDQLKISLEFEKRPKPTDIALEEVSHGKIQRRYKEPVVVPKEEKETE
jgi:DNA-directed RNA polymerase omega subunit